MSSESSQLLLPFSPVQGYDARDFLSAGSNQRVLAWLEVDWPDRRLAIWGPAGCGKSHLLHMWAERTHARILTGQMLTDRVLVDLGSLPLNAAVALDDADAVTSEPLLLHLLNTARDRAAYVLLCARTPPARWTVSLPDLSSRLRVITAAEIEPLNDDLLAALLVRLLSDRQLKVARPVQAWLLTRLPRSPAALRQAVARLDQASLMSRRPITRPFAAEALKGIVIPDANEVSMSTVHPTSNLSGIL